MYKLNYKLKQHTPIIHFQYNEKGATLRVSELKPKLDRFLIKKVFNNDFDKCKEFLIGYSKSNENKIRKKFDKEDFKALDYKPKIIGDVGLVKKIEEGRRNQYGFFFGTIGKEYRDKPKGLVFAENEIDLKIQSFNILLLSIVEQNIVMFFEQNNFGTRQSKGFGSFTITKKISKNLIEEIPFSNIGYKTSFSVRLNNRDWFSGYKKAFNEMNLFYKALRSGINLKGRGERGQPGPDLFYFKSLVFLYAKNEFNIQWEKKTIKEEFFNGQTNTQKKDRPKSKPLHFVSKEKNIFKDLLGLSSDESWYSYDATISKVQARNVGGSWKEMEKKNITFDRFKSPITFKPILVGNKLEVYLYLNQDEVDQAISINKDFLIKKGTSSFHMALPDSFSLDKFFNFFLDNNNFRISTHVEPKFQRTGEYDTLNSIFRELQANKND